jgi:hypothetical protein
MIQVHADQPTLLLNRDLDFRFHEHGLLVRIGANQKDERIARRILSRQAVLMYDGFSELIASSS